MLRAAMSLTSGSNPPAAGSLPVQPAVADLPGHLLEIGRDAPVALACGQSLGPFQVAYQTNRTQSAYNAKAVLGCAALTGDQ
ncbi:MAG: hypothetical protein VW644_11280 [Alphaproteobacteria bacterium]